MYGTKFIDRDGDFVSVGGISEHGDCYVFAEWPDIDRKAGAVLTVDQLRSLRDHLTCAIEAYDASIGTPER